MEPKTEGFSADKTLSRHIMSDLAGTPQLRPAKNCAGKDATHRSVQPAKNVTQCLDIKQWQTSETKKMGLKTGREERQEVKGQRL